MDWIRVETMEQLKEAFAVRMEVFVKEQGVPADVELDEYDDSPDACRHYIVRSGGDTIAAGRYRTYEPGVAKMQRIAVRKRHRGKGVGAFLLKAMEEEAGREGYRASILDAQCSAEAFYLKQGYATVSKEPFLDAGIPHVRMSKRLDL
ncbi:GNAT family N-acetyltransferase [Cohnella hongkongensis]|uniref:GNAT family N-acetyltransferase n=1 Tax=Cohnella hongkongensis TaxID=178337 RepID=A0ABV9FAY9_9BACL